MNKAAMHLYEEMLQEEESLFSNAQSTAVAHLSAVRAISGSIGKLNNLLREQAFEDQQEEIHFFKEIRPSFDGRLQFHLHLLSQEALAPIAAPDKGVFYRQELKRLRAYGKLNRPFSDYLLSGDNLLDAYYFLRTASVDPAFIGDYGHVYDPVLFARASARQARLKAGKLLADLYLENLMDLAGSHAAVTGHAEHLVWEGNKVWLAELVYAFYASGVFGKVDLQRVARFVSTAFGVRFANAYKIFEEIRIRKKNRTSFLDYMRLNLVRRMDLDDEFSL